jgi:Fuc2NAc and GlcNAc transferase
MAILIGLLAALTIFGAYSPAFLLGLVSAVIIAGISFLDDLIRVPSIPRLVVHLVVTTAVIFLLDLELTKIVLPYVTLHLPRWAGLTVSVLFVAGFINFFNFMDGINGIACSQGFFGGLTLAVLLFLGGRSSSVLLAVALTGTCVGFLPHNFPRARIFMGDSGSTIIGYVLAMLTLIGARGTDTSWVAFVLPLGVFLYDATFTLIKRVLRRENFFKPHREHHYQLLVRCEWSHTSVTAVQAGLMLLCSIGAVIYAITSEAPALQVGVICVLGVFAAAYSILVHRYFATHRKDIVTESQPRLRR